MMEESKCREEVGALIRQAREELGLTVTKLGWLVYGKSGKSNVSRVERGEIGTSLVTALRYLEHLKLRGANRIRFLELTGLIDLTRILQQEGVPALVNDIDVAEQGTTGHLSDSYPNSGTSSILACESAWPWYLGMAARNIQLLGHWELAQAYYNEMADMLPVGSEQAQARIDAAHQFINLGDLKSAQKALDQISSEYKDLADPLTFAWIDFRQGWIHQMVGRYHDAEDCFQRALQPARQFADQRLEWNVLHFLDRNMYEIAYRAESSKLMQAALAQFQKHMDSGPSFSVWPTAYLWHAYHFRWIARCLDYLGKCEEARHNRDTALWMWKTDGVPYRPAYAHLDDAQMDLHDKEYAQGIENLYESAALFGEVRCIDSVAECLIMLAEIYLEQGRSDLLPHIADLCISAVSLYPYPQNPPIQKGLDILYLLGQVERELIEKRVIQLQADPEFSARSTRDLVTEPLEQMASPSAAYQIIASRLRMNHFL